MVDWFYAFAGQLIFFKPNNFQGQLQKFQSLKHFKIRKKDKDQKRTLPRNIHHLFDQRHLTDVTQKKNAPY